MFQYKFVVLSLVGLLATGMGLRAGENCTCPKSISTPVCGLGKCAMVHKGCNWKADWNNDDKPIMEENNIPLMRESTSSSKKSCTYSLQGGKTVIFRLEKSKD